MVYFQTVSQPHRRALGLFALPHLNLPRTWQSLRPTGQSHPPPTLSSPTPPPPAWPSHPESVLLSLGVDSFVDAQIRMSLHMIQLDRLPVHHHCGRSGGSVSWHVWLYQCKKNFIIKKLYKSYVVFHAIYFTARYFFQTDTTHWWSLRRGCMFEFFPNLTLNDSNSTW